MSGALILEGRMAESARAGCTRADAWSLQAVFELPALPGIKPLLVRVIKPYGQGPAAASACKRRAAELRPGVLVRVTSSHLRTRRGGLEAVGVQTLAAPDLEAAQRAQFVSRFGD